MAIQTNPGVLRLPSFKKSVPTGPFRPVPTPFAQTGNRNRTIGAGMPKFNPIKINTRPRMTAEQIRSQYPEYQPGQEGGLVQQRKNIGLLSYQTRNVDGQLVGLPPGAADPNPTFLEQMGGVLFDETGRLQQAADYNRARVDSEIEGIRGTLDDASSSFLELGFGQAQDLIGLANRQQGEFEAGATDVVSSYEDRTAQDAHSTVLGIRRDMQNELTELGNRMNPDGSEMTNDEYLSRKADLQRRTAESVQQTTTGIYSNFNNNLASLKTALNQQRLSMQAGVRELYMASQGLQTAALGQAANLQLQGRFQLANLIQSNPMSIVSLYSAMAEMFKLATAPGATRVGGLPSSVLGQYS